jgi:major membrane immunogen (membrane-anchored lipoprotein)
MKKILTILVLSIVLVGCSSGDKARTSKEGMKTVCLDGVTYYLFRESTYSEGYGFMSVKFDRESKIVPCSE